MTAVAIVAAAWCAVSIPAALLVGRGIHVGRGPAVPQRTTITERTRP